MNSKIELIDEYITKAKECIENENFLYAEKLNGEIINTFRNDIKYIWVGTEDDKEHPLQMLSLLISKLRNLKGDLEIEENKQNSEKALVLEQTLNTSISIQISFEQTITAIEAIPNEILSHDEKEQLEGKLSKLNTEKDKSKLWEKAQSVLKWIADKGFEVGIAALPYIAEALKSAK